ncbi:MAG TPA: ORF6N domain-containing protein [Puia sp.]|nr:ORF6N domain-containing protein [Puia sp.]
MELPVIQNKIYEIRGQKVMLDFDLAALYEVETKVFNQAVKRNINRFPSDFMFQLTSAEWEGNWSQFVTTSDTGSPSESQDIDNQLETSPSNSSQFVTTSKKHRGKTYLPYAFTEHGVTMLASVLRSEKAVNMGIAVVRAFIALKQYALKHQDLTGQLQELRDRLGEHDVQLNSIYDAIENLLDEKVDQKAWQERERIGFKK